MFFHVYRGRLAGGTHHHDAVRALINMKINQRTKSSQIQAPVLVHRRDYRNDTAFNHGEHGPYPALCTAK